MSLIFLDPSQVHLLVDGHNLAYQALFGSGEAHKLIPNLGKVVDVFMRKIRGIYSGLYVMKPRTIVCFDTPSSKLSRQEQFQSYKANRHHNENASKAVYAIQKHLSENGYIVLSQDRVEADDIIATLADKLTTSIIVTADRDLLQCISPYCFVYAVRPKDYVFYNREVFYREYRFEPRRLPDYKALMGDHSDNIPGIRGMGGFLAKRLISEYGSLEGIYKAIDNNEHIPLRDDLYHQLVRDRSKIYLYKRLCTVNREVVLDPSIEILSNLDDSHETTQLVNSMNGGDTYGKQSPEA